MDLNLIDNFTCEFAFLSNFFPSEIRFEGISYPSVEHAYQAQKTLDVAERRKIAACASAGRSKRMGRTVTLRKDWEAVKVSVMTELVRLKFQTHDDLRQKLLATGEAELVEGNSWNDRFWGKTHGVGKNWLGRILMQVRGEFFSQAENASDSVI